MFEAYLMTPYEIGKASKRELRDYLENVRGFFVDLDESIKEIRETAIADYWEERK
jgi:hypothetical protein